jgi:hypothetical protein
MYHGRFLERCLCIESGIEVRAFVEMSADSGGPKKIFRAQANLTTDNKFTYSYTNGLCLHAAPIPSDRYGRTCNRLRAYLASDTMTSSEWINDCRNYLSDSDFAHHRARAGAQGHRALGPPLSAYVRRQASILHRVLKKRKSFKTNM